MPDSQVHGEVTCLKTTGFCYFFTLDVKKLRLGVWLGLRALAHPHHDEHAGRFKVPWAFTSQIHLWEALLPLLPF